MTPLVVEDFGTQMRQSQRASDRTRLEDRQRDALSSKLTVSKIDGFEYHISSDIVLGVIPMSSLTTSEISSLSRPDTTTDCEAVRSFRSSVSLIPGMLSIFEALISNLELKTSTRTSEVNLPNFRKIMEMGKDFVKWRNVFDLYKDDEDNLTRDGLALMLFDNAHLMISSEPLLEIAHSYLPFRASFDEFLAMVRGNRVSWSHHLNHSEQIAEQVLFAALKPSDRIALELAFDLEAEIYRSQRQLDEISADPTIETCPLSFI